MRGYVSCMASYMNVMRLVTSLATDKRMGSATGGVAGVRTPPIILGWGTDPSNNPCIYVNFCSFSFVKKQNKIK